MMCTMKLRHELTYRAPLGDVFAMLIDTAYWDRVAVATGALSSTATVETVAGEFRVVIDQDQPVAGVPSFAKKFVGDSARAIKRQTWTGHTSTFVVETPGKPTTMAGTAVLEERGETTVLSYDLEVRASVPLIGGKLEKLVVGLTTDGFEKEQAVGADWLRGEHR
jgi:hypothetical protein